MKEKIIEILKKNSGHLNRGRIWVELQLPNGIPTPDYWTAEQSLVDEKLIERRTGRTGGIYLLNGGKAPNQQAQAQEIAQENTKESKHWNPALQTILGNWTDQGFKEVFGAVTAQAGRKPTGAWSRPDVTICTISEWIFSSRPDGDVRTFEVKRFAALNGLGVYEALSHKSRAHYAYLLVVEFPESLDETQRSDFDAILDIASRHGIGVITSRDTKDWKTWDFVLDPRKSDADSFAVNQFLLDQVPPDVRGNFQKSLRSITVTI